MKILYVCLWEANENHCYDITSKESLENVVFSLFDFILKSIYNGKLPPKITNEQEFFDYYGSKENAKRFSTFELWQEEENEEREILYNALEARKANDVNKLLHCLCESQDFGKIEVSELEIDYKDPIIFVSNENDDI